jgi:hypothetical protein
MLNEIDEFIQENCSLRKIEINFNKNGSVYIVKMYTIKD